MNLDQNIFIYSEIKCTTREVPPPGWVLHRGPHYSALLVLLATCHTPGSRSMNFPICKITAAWEKQCFSNLPGVPSPGNAKQGFAFVPQFPAFKTRRVTVLQCRGV